MKTIDQWRAAIREALERNGTYNRALDFTIDTLANHMRANELVSQSLDDMDSAILIKKSRYGEEPIEHPIFKTLKKTSDAITSLCSQLQLTPEELNTDSASDPLVNLTEELIGIK